MLAWRTGCHLTYKEERMRSFFNEWPPGGPSALGARCYAFCSSRAGLLAYLPLVMGVGEQENPDQGQGDILYLKLILGLISFETDFHYPEHWWQVWHQPREETHHSPPILVPILCAGHMQVRKKLLVSFREYDGRSDLHVGITNTNGECIFIVFFFLSLKSAQNTQSEERSISRQKVIVATFN